MTIRYFVNILAILRDIFVLRVNAVLLEGNILIYDKKVIGEVISFCGIHTC